MKLGIVKDISNAEYHKQRSREEHFYSSSQLKTILDDAETFKKKYITGELEDKSSNPVFDIGTYFHTAILEPHLLDKECAVFTGKRRAGKEWVAFQKEHEGKAIITKNEFEQVKNLIVATERSDLAMDLHTGGEPEISLFVELYVYDNKVYCANDECSWEMTTRGWKKDESFNKKFFTCPIRLKVRCDYINVKKGYMADLKSTTGNAKDVNKTRNKISSYSYDLSAAMYIDLFNAYALTNGEDWQLKTFWWVFASKDYSNCQCYYTGVGLEGEIEDSNLKVGRAKWIKAAKLIAENEAENWEIPEKAVGLKAQTWELEWLEGAQPNPKFSNNKTKVKQTDQPVSIDLL